jgi:GNAT superfamily N-acetyltransferase
LKYLKLTVYRQATLLLFSGIAMSSLVIRPASVKDVSSIVKIRSGAFTEEEVSGFIVPGESLYSSIEKLQQMWGRGNFLKDGFEVFVAECESRVVGFIVYNMRSSDDNIDNVVVAKEEQGKGVGRALVGYVEEIARSRGLSVMKTDTTENAEGIAWKAYGFWRRMGYDDNGKRVSTEYDFKVIPLVKKLK